MTYDELENWKSVQYRMDDEGFDYCFENYSNWDEIKDEEFHRLRLGFLQSMKELREYIDSKVEEGENLELEINYGRIIRFNGPSSCGRFRSSNGNLH